ncbi:MAG: hypothetical protein ACK2UW_16590, partial [Anaerolineales bacterium]
MKPRKTLWYILALLLIASLTLAACAPQATPAPTEAPTEPQATAEPTTPPAAGMPEVDFAYFPGGYLEQAINGDFSGTSV